MKTSEATIPKSFQVSVIIPAYNVENYICRCLDSLINQDCSIDYELVVVNDGSTDSTGEILAKYAQEYSFIKIITQANGGLSAARNTGIEAATGEFIAFVDSDDFVEPGYISLMYTAAYQNDADVVCCNYRNTDEEGEPILENFLIHTPGVYDSSIVLKDTLADIFMRSYVWNKLYRRSIFAVNNIRFPLGMKFEDFPIMPQVIYYSRRVAFIKDCLYNYVHRRGSITGTMKKSAVEDYVTGYCMVRGFLESKNLYRENRFLMYCLRKKISLTTLGMLLRCYAADPKNTHVLANYSKIRKCLRLHSGDKYYFTSGKQLEASRVLM